MWDDDVCRVGVMRGRALEEEGGGWDLSKWRVMYHPAGSTLSRLVQPVSVYLGLTRQNPGNAQVHLLLMTKLGLLLLLPKCQHLLTTICEYALVVIYTTVGPCRRTIEDSESILRTKTQVVYVRYSTTKAHVRIVSCRRWLGAEDVCTHGWYVHDTTRMFALK